MRTHEWARHFSLEDCLTPSQSAHLAGSPQTATFYSVCEAALPGLSLVVDGVVLLGAFFGASAYLIVATDSFTHLAGSAVRWPWTLLSTAIVTPFTFLRRLDALRFTSTLAIAVLVSLSLLVVCFAFGAHGNGTATLLQPCPRGREHCHGQTHLLTSPLPTLRASSLIINAYICQQNLFSVARELERPTPSRLLLVIGARAVRPGRVVLCLRAGVPSGV